MALCSDNFTLGIFVSTSQKFIKLEKNRISGMAGKYYQNFLKSKRFK